MILYVPKTDDTPKNDQKSKTKVFFGQNYKCFKNPDGTACLKGCIKIRITLLLHPLLLRTRIVKSMNVLNARFVEWKMC